MENTTKIDLLGPCPHRAYKVDPKCGSELCDCKNKEHDHYIRAYKLMASELIKPTDIFLGGCCNIVIK